MVVSTNEDLREENYSNQKTCRFVTSTRISFITITEPTVAELEKYRVAGVDIVSLSSSRRGFLTFELVN